MIHFGARPAHPVRALAAAAVTNREQIQNVLQVFREVATPAGDAASGQVAAADPTAATDARSPRSAPLASPDADTARLIRRHGLAPLAYRAGYAAFRADFIASAMAAELRAAQLAEAARALAAAGVPVILLKGASYASALYADPAERPMTDIDLLVPARAHASATAALRRLGYWHAGTGADRAATHHATTLKRPGGAIDLHRRMVQPWRSRIDERGLWRRARPAADTAAMRLCPRDELLLHLVHIARHELAVPLISYVDGVRLVARNRDILPDLLDFSARCRVSRAVRAALEMTRRLTGELARDPRLLPSPAEIARAAPVPRPLQIMRKAALVDGPVQLIGLVAVALFERMHRLGV